MISPLASPHSHVQPHLPAAASTAGPQGGAEGIQGPGESRRAEDEASISPRGIAELLHAEVEEQDEGNDPTGQQLTEEEEEIVREMRARDREVRAHEQAHKAAAGDLAPGPPRYETEQGPDGRSYAVGGEVSINLREGDTPEETVQIAQRAQRAALAPAEPSPQDRAVAAQASQMAAQAQAEVVEERQAERSGGEQEDGASALASVEGSEDARDVDDVAPVAQVDAAALSMLQQRDSAYRAISAGTSGLL